MGRKKSTPVMRALAAIAVFLVVGCTSIHRQPVPIEDIDRAVNLLVAAWDALRG